MPPPRIAIIGAGLGGLSLSRGLQAHGIRAVVYEQAGPNPRHEYGMTLSPHTCNLLLTLLKLDAASLERRIGVERHLVSLSSSLSSSPPPPSDELLTSRIASQKPLRAHRRRLEEVLREGTDVRWRHTLEAIDLGGGQEGGAGGEKTLTFKVRSGEDKEAPAATETAAYDYVVAADGVHSAARKALLPAVEPTVLPYVAVNGKRRVPVADFERDYGAAFRDGAGGPVLVRRVGDARLQIDVFDRTDDNVSISWIYSRRAAADGGRPDALFAPDRPKTAAADIPEAFYEDIAALGLTEQPFRDVFDVQKLRGERTLSWLMRTTEGGASDLRTLAERGVVFIGDSVHAEPILGGEGANRAIEDGMELANWIADKGPETVVEWCEKRCSEWEAGVAASRREIDEMHALEKAVL